MTLPKLHQVTFSLLFVTFGSGCSLLGGGGGLIPSIGGAIGAKTYGQYDNSTGISIGRGERELKIQTAIEVTPDKATLPMSINAHGSSFDEAAAQMTTAFGDLKKLAGCKFRIVDYKVPTSKDNKKWKTGGSAELSVDTTGKDEDARITAVNTCFKAAREHVLNLPLYSGDAASGTEMAQGATIGPDIIWSVEVLDKHRDALVTQANDRLKQVQKADAKMWDHADIQCTSAGVVQVASVNSHFVTLQLEMVCAVSASEYLTRVKTQ